MAVARVMAGNGFRVQLADRPAPTPALSYRIIEAGACGGVIVTSSHNPFRLERDQGEAALRRQRQPGDRRRHRAPGARDPRTRPAKIAAAPLASDIQRFDPVPGYLARLEREGRHPAHPSRPACKSPSTRCTAPAWACSTSCSPAEARRSRRSTPNETRSSRAFARPSRSSRTSASSCSSWPAATIDIGIANDGDADRVGLVDEQGNYVDQLRAFALLVNYLLGERGLRGPVVKSVTTTNMARHAGEALRRRRASRRPSASSTSAR